MTKNKTDNLSDSTAEALQRGGRKAVDIIKTQVFDLAGIAIVIISALVSLQALKIIENVFANIDDVLINFIPFWFASTLLDDNFYLKGTFKGKVTEKYNNAISAYSAMAESITGAQLDKLGEFCIIFNEKALVNLQTSMLHKKAISYERFSEETLDEAGNVLKPLKALNKKELLQLYNKETVKVILAAQNASVKGINETILLSNIRAADETDLGKTESELKTKHTIVAVIKYALFMFIFSLITFKEISEWGWSGAILVLFKMIWTFVKTYLSYFSGYNDITIKLVGHVVRKGDILKQFKFWYDTKENVVK